MPASAASPIAFALPATPREADLPAKYLRGPLADNAEHVAACGQIYSTQAP